MLMDSGRAHHRHAQHDDVWFELHEVLISQSPPTHAVATEVVCDHIADTHNLFR